MYVSRLILAFLSQVWAWACISWRVLLLHSSSHRLSLYKEGILWSGGRRCCFSYLLKNIALFFREIAILKTMILLFCFDGWSIHLFISCQQPIRLIRILSTSNRGQWKHLFTFIILKLTWPVWPRDLTRRSTHTASSSHALLYWNFEWSNNTSELMLPVIFYNASLFIVSKCDKVMIMDWRFSGFSKELTNKRKKVSASRINYLKKYVCTFLSFTVR